MWTAVGCCCLSEGRYSPLPLGFMADPRLFCFSPAEEESADKALFHQLEELAAVLSALTTRCLRPPSCLHRAVGSGREDFMALGIQRANTVETITLLCSKPEDIQLPTGSLLNTRRPLNIQSQSCEAQREREGISGFLVFLGYRHLLSSLELGKRVRDGWETDAGSVPAAFAPSYKPPCVKDVFLKHRFHRCFIPGL